MSPAAPTRPRSARALPWAGAALAAGVLLEVRGPAPGEPGGLAAVGGCVALAAALWIALSPGSVGRRAVAGLLVLGLVLGLGPRWGWDLRGLVDLLVLAPLLPLLLPACVLATPTGLRVAGWLAALTLAEHPLPVSVLALLPLPAPLVGLVGAALGAALVGHGLARLAFLESRPRDLLVLLGALAVLGGSWGATPDAVLAAPDPDDELVTWERTPPAAWAVAGVLGPEPALLVLAPEVEADAGHLELVRVRDGRALESPLVEGPSPGCWSVILPRGLPPGRWGTRVELRREGRYLGNRFGGEFDAHVPRASLALALLLAACLLLGRRGSALALVPLVLALVPGALGLLRSLLAGA